MRRTTCSMIGTINSCLFIYFHWVLIDSNELLSSATHFTTWPVGMPCSNERATLPFISQPERANHKILQIIRRDIKHCGLCPKEHSIDLKKMRYDDLRTSNSSVDFLHSDYLFTCFSALIPAKAVINLEPWKEYPINLNVACTTVPW